MDSQSFDGFSIMLQAPIEEYLYSNPLAPYSGPGFPGSFELRIQCKGPKGDKDIGVSALGSSLGYFNASYETRAYVPSDAPVKAYRAARSWFEKNAPQEGDEHFIFSYAKEAIDGGATVDMQRRPVLIPD